jgi:hypothetical protein
VITRLATTENPRRRKRRHTTSVPCEARASLSKALGPNAPNAMIETDPRVKDATMAGITTTSKAVQIPRQSQATRNKASAQRNWDKVEQHLSQVEKSQGFARAWKLREQFEQGRIKLHDLTRR